MHPGEFLKARVLPDLGLSVEHLAERLDIQPGRLRDLLEAKCRLSVDVARKLSGVHGSLPPMFWLGLQRAHDQWTLSELWFNRTN